MAQAGRKPQIFESTRVPLVGIPTSRQATGGAFIDKDQRFINFLPVKYSNPLTGKETFFLIKRPGLAANSTPAAGSVGTALHVWETVGSGSTILSAFGATNSTLYENTTSKGAITGRARGISESDATGTSTAVLISTDSTGWVYPTGGSLAEITDSDFPGKASRTLVGHAVHMDGYMFVMDSVGRIYNSDLNSLTAWTANSFIAPTYYTGNGVGLARMHDSVVAITTSSVEFFVNEGATPSPLARREMIASKVGGVLPASHGQTLSQLRDTVYFIGVSPTGGGGVYAISKYTVKKISSMVVDQQIEVAEPQNCTLAAFKLWGMDFLVMACGTIQYLYNVEQELWSELAAGDAGVLWSICAGASSGDGRVFTLSSSATTGKVYEWNTDTPVWQDDSTAYTATIQTSKVDFETEKRKRYHKIKLLGDKQSSTCTVAISWSDDDYGTFSTARNVDMSSDRAYLSVCGIARRRAFKLTNATNTPCRLEALEFDYSLCET